MRTTKKFVVGLFTAMAVIHGIQEVQAEERSQRKGFVIGFDVGVGGLHLDKGARTGVLVGGFKIGGGISERVLLLAEEFGSIGFDSDLSGTSGLYFASQLFLTDHFYVRPAVGFAYNEKDVPGGGTLSSDLGFAAGIASGYEFRLTKRFALSPEVKWGYARIEGGNHFHYGGVVDRRWYF